jgi:hypothetical protein
MDNNQQDNNLALRISIGSAFVASGIVIGEPMLDRVLKATPAEPAPWWAITLLVIAMIMLVSGLLILVVPRKTWRRIGYNIRYGFPLQIQKMYHMRRYGPKIDNSTPTFNKTMSEISGTYDVTIVATFNIEIKPSTKPVKVNLNSVTLYVGAEEDWDNRCVIISLSHKDLIPEIYLQPGDPPWRQTITISTKINRATKDDIPRIKPHPNWGIDGIKVTLPKMGLISIRKGIKRPREGHALYLY